MILYKILIIIGKISYILFCNVFIMYIKDLEKNVVCYMFVSCVYLFIFLKSNCFLIDDRILINLIVIEVIMCK